MLYVFGCCCFFGHFASSVVHGLHAKKPQTDATSSLYKSLNAVENYHYSGKDRGVSESKLHINNCSETDYQVKSRSYYQVKLRSFIFEAFSRIMSPSCCTVFNEKEVVADGLTGELAKKATKKKLHDDKPKSILASKCPYNNFLNSIPFVLPNDCFSWFSK
ncbi:hypothetical protein BD770DRAFT_408284 [Pilaira anomala]|nr:hypothetical protein BD770DRAFT_408284 [Pilaira anomala]